MSTDFSCKFICIFKFFVIFIEYLSHYVVILEILNFLSKFQIFSYYLIINYNLFSFLQYFLFIDENIVLHCEVANFERACFYKNLKNHLLIFHINAWVMIIVMEKWNFLRHILINMLSCYGNLLKKLLFLNNKFQ